MKSISTFRISVALLFFTLLLTNLTNAQPQKGKSIKASIGLGLSAPYDDVDLTGSGFYAQGEYVIGITRWFGVRPYAGVVFTSADENENLPGYKVTSDAFLFGGKARVVAPIPYVAPYIEVGLGGSIGSFETYTPFTNIKKNGMLVHIPFSLGLAIGKKHSIELEFTYYYHPAAEQFSGAAAIGFTFPLK